MYCFPRNSRAFTIRTIPITIIFLIAGCASPEQARDGSQRSSSGNVIHMEDVEDLGYSSIEELLIARVPSVRRAPGGEGIIIRGTRTVSGSNEPLYVIDGVPSSSSPLIHLYDVDEIEVLSSPNELARYGSQGMHGVILIRTKGP